jgi:hypothetical protein
MPAIIREATNSMTAEVTTDVRTQGERADDIVFSTAVTFGVAVVNLAGMLDVVRIHRGLWVVIDRQRRSLQDIAFRTRVVLLTPSGRVTTGRVCFVSTGEQLPVDLYDREKERRADAEQQRAVHRF